MEFTDIVKLKTLIVKVSKNTLTNIYLIITYTNYLFLAENIHLSRKKIELI